MIRNFRELWQYRALLWNLTQRELKARYRGSTLGFLWTFANHSQGSSPTKMKYV